MVPGAARDAPRFDWQRAVFVLGIGSLAGFLGLGFYHSFETGGRLPALGLTPYVVADALRERGELDAALGEYRSVVRIWPADLQAAQRYAEAVSQTDDALAIVEARRRVAELARDTPAAWIALGAAQLRAGRPGEAALAFEAALALDPTSLEALMSLGNARMAEGLPDAAVAAFARGLEREPDHVRLRSNLGIALARSGRLPEAAAELKRALALRHEPQTAAALAEVRALMARAESGAP